MKHAVTRISFVMLLALPTLTTMAGESPYDPGSGPAHAAAMAHRACDPQLKTANRNMVFAQDGERKLRIRKEVGEARKAADNGDTQGCLNHAKAAANM